MTKSFIKRWERFWKLFEVAHRALSEGSGLWLNALAIQQNPRVTRWVAIRQTARRRSYVCNLCGVLIDTESARDARTKHAVAAVTAHCEEHMRETSIDLDVARVRAGLIDIKHFKEPRQVDIDAALDAWTT